MAATYHFTGKRAAVREATLTRSFVWLDDAGSPVNVTGMTGEMDVRPFAGSADRILHLTSEITCGNTNGHVDILVPAGTMDVGDESSPTTYVYDLFILNGSTRTCILSGDFEIVPNVTEF